MNFANPVVLQKQSLPVFHCCGRYRCRAFRAMVPLQTDAAIGLSNRPSSDRRLCPRITRTPRAALGGCAAFLI